MNISLNTIIWFQVTNNKNPTIHLKFQVTIIIVKLCKLFLSIIINKNNLHTVM